MRRAQPPRKPAPPSNAGFSRDFFKGPAFGPFCLRTVMLNCDAGFVVGTVPINYIAAMVSRAQRIILADHTRLPWRFFGRLTAVQAGL